MPSFTEAMSRSDLLPPWVPKTPPEEWTLTEVVNHVKTGMMIELYTIPLYLYAKHSIKDEGAGSGARGKIQGIFVQEMLHLALSGNLLCALDGSMALYDFSIIPHFPGTILYERVKMNLDRANKANLDLFVQIEAPFHPPNFLNKAPEIAVIPEYKSIGEFYQSLQAGLKALPDNAFKNNKDYQFSPEDFSFRGGMATINDRDTAEEKLELIIVQGEGGPDNENSHYSIFSDLAGKSSTWELYDVRQNPKTSDYKDLGDSKRFAYKLSLSVDAAYCYLLQTIQRVWGRGGDVPALHQHLVQNIRTLMPVVLTPLADLLVLQKLTDTDFAAPCFNYYPLEDDKPLTPLEPDDLHSGLVKLVKDAAAAAPDAASKDSLEKLATEIEGNMKPRP